MAQTKKKFLENNSVGGTKIQLENNTYLRGRNNANSADINTFKVNASDRVEFASVPQVPSDAAAANDLVRYSQFQAFLEGVKPKQGVVTVSLVDIDLAVAADPGSVGGQALANNDRVLLANQTASEENGIYVAVTATNPTTWVRSDDFNAASEIPGSSIPVRFGTHQGYLYVNTVFPTVLNTDPISFAFRAAGATINTREELITLNGTNITNQYIDLAEAATSTESISLFPVGGPIQEKGVDYTISLTGGAGGVTRITFAGDLATSGAAELISGDKLAFRYTYI